jgi:aldehyde dehydrogenase (NAD+)
MPDASSYREERLFIGGEWVKPIDGESAVSVDPATGREWATVAFAGRCDIDRAVAAANEALEGPWGRMSGWDRANLLRRFAALYEAAAPRLAELETRDNGRAIRESRADVGNHHNWYQYYASLADKLDGRVVPFDPGMHIFTTRLPVGVVGAIVPWNAPLLTTAWKLGPALAAGCTVVLKAAETTPVSALELARIAAEAGLPPGVLNVVPGLGHVAGAHLVGHPDVNKIAFTGETRTAQEIMRAGAVNIKRLSFELGGKAPHILFEDADLEQALNAATHSGFVGCGQSCALGSRLFVHRSIYDTVVAEIARRAERIRVGDPLDAATQMGPQAHDQQLAKTLQYIEIGRQEGARLVAGGGRIVDGDLARGCYVRPTLFADVHNRMRIAQEEIFGPVIAAIPFDDEAEVIAMANDTQYGLTAGLWTRDVGRAHRVSGRIKAGMVWVNTYRFIRWSFPYGGFKMSGLGRENGPEALANYLETRSTVMSLTGSYPDAYAQ